MYPQGLPEARARLLYLHAAVTAINARMAGNIRNHIHTVQLCRVAASGCPAQTGVMTFLIKNTILDQSSQGMMPCDSLQGTPELRYYLDCYKH